VGVVACGGSTRSASERPPADTQARTSHGPLGHRFAVAQDWVDRFEGPDRDRWQRPEHVVALVGVVPGMTVADLGAGTGYFEPYLSRAVGETGRVLALDIEPSMIDYIDKRAAAAGLVNVEARVIGVDDPALPAGGIDRVLIVNTWHHIAARARYAERLRAGLRSGGAVYIVDFTLDTELGPPRRHRLAPEVVVAELVAGGLDASVVAGDGLEHQYVVVGKKR